MKSLKTVLVSAVVCASSAAFAAGGTLTGTVSFEGTPPAMEPLKANADPFCSTTAATDETVLIKNGKLRNVAIRLVNGPAGTAPTEPVVIDQVACMYRPRVSVAVEGQQLLIKNSDGTLHNVHSYVGTKTAFNQAQPPNAAPLQKPFKAADVMTLKCDVHPWMKGYIVYSKSPYAAVTAEDGKFEIKGIPPGKYTVETWHEKLGTQTQEVTVTEDKSTTLNVTYAAPK
jgi:hypothetical protein